MGCASASAAKPLTRPAASRRLAATKTPMTIRLTVSATALRWASVRVGRCWPHAAADANPSKPSEKRMCTSGHRRGRQKPRAWLRSLSRLRYSLPSRHAVAGRPHAWRMELQRGNYGGNNGPEGPVIVLPRGHPDPSSPLAQRDLPSGFCVTASPKLNQCREELTAELRACDPLTQSQRVARRFVHVSPHFASAWPSSQRRADKSPSSLSSSATSRCPGVKTSTELSALVP